MTIEHVLMQRVHLPPRPPPKMGGSRRDGGLSGQTNPIYDKWHSKLVEIKKMKMFRDSNSSPAPDQYLQCMHQIKNVVREIIICKSNTPVKPKTKR